MTELLNCLNCYRGYTNLNVWAYGNLHNERGKYFIEDETESKYRVSEKSVGLRVGLGINSNNDIGYSEFFYTGDIVKFEAKRQSRVVEKFAPDGIDEIMAVVDIQNGCIIFRSGLFFDGYITSIDCCIDTIKVDEIGTLSCGIYDCCILGNIYENADILEKS